MKTTKTKTRYVIVSHKGKKYLDKNCRPTKKLKRAAIYNTEQRAKNALDLAKTVCNETVGEHPKRLEKLQNVAVTPITVKVTKKYAL